MTSTFRLGALAAALLSTTVLSAPAAEMFNRVSAISSAANAPEPGKESVAEIIAATEDGMTLVYTDSPQGGIGLVDITDPAAPKAAGFVALSGEPTSVKVIGEKAIVGVVTSESKDKPAGHLAVVDIASKAVDGTCDLGGQPDSVALSPDKGFVAIAIENERDEDVNDGALPQLPGGFLAVLTVKDGLPACDSLKKVELTGLAEVAPEDPEPEFVSVNGRNEAVVTFQENNHIAIVDLATAKVVAHYTAGAVTLTGIDTEKDGAIALTGEMKDVPREPDGVVWIDDERFVTANEGDFKGGTRGFSIFGRDGKVLYDAGATLEHEMVALGHYNDKRNKKGIEIEGVDAATFGADKLIFVASERASLVAVYRDTGAEPELLQMLPSGIGPEGTLAIPSRNLFVTANETDLVEDGGVRAHVMIYARGEGEAVYPTIRSASKDGLPIPFGALSGLTADRTQPGKLYAVTDSIYKAAPRILTIDATSKPAMVTDAITVTRDGKPGEKLDFEGIATRADGTFWVASEGHVKNELKNLLLKVGADGAIQEEIELPAELVAGMTSNGLEGVTVTGEGDAETVWLAVQREWKSDPKGMAMLLAYTPATKAWGVVHYPLEKAAGEGAWVGLSEITAVGDKLIIIERDNQIGEAAGLKTLTEVSLAGVTPAPVGASEIPVVKKSVVRDLVPDLAAFNGYVVDKVEGFAVDANGEAYVVTDNDGVDDSSGETYFLKLGKDIAVR
ncbi:esterase-like activity of phytase family protein [Chthonobacter rhizosphaerae]|uniref:esterase-like activity of phytase family protein n=1 Tax=Chthonobacter rhizosphaerae TaxID=2735553 RepID=UPI0015EF1F9E|nr:esterase-like activity of phytase family protein [Chthonobacter rhizosphaerae]